MPAVRALWYERGTLHLLDQRCLPGATVIRSLTRIDEVAEAIRDMAVFTAAREPGTSALRMNVPAGASAMTVRTLSATLCVMLTSCKKIISNF